MKLMGMYQVAVGLAIAGLWLLLLGTGQVPQVPEGLPSIWFHLAAELGTAALLLAGGFALLRGTAPEARLLTGVALGALLYTTVNSPGYYADRGDWATVGMFALPAVATAGAIASLVLTRPGRRPRDSSAASARQEAALAYVDGAPDGAGAANEAVSR